MKIPGVVTNITAFGAFVDIGVHQDGLVHISELADRYVRKPADVVKVQQKVSVTVLDIDLARNRIALSMKSGASGKQVDAKKASGKKNRARSTGSRRRGNRRPAVTGSLAEALIQSGLRQR